MNTVPTHRKTHLCFSVASESVVLNRFYIGHQVVTKYSSQIVYCMEFATFTIWATNVYAHKYKFTSVEVGERDRIL